MHKEVSSVMLSEAGVRKPGSNWLEQKRNLLSCIIRSPEVNQGCLIQRHNNMVKDQVSSHLFSLLSNYWLHPMADSTNQVNRLPFLCLEGEKGLSPSWGELPPILQGFDWSSVSYIPILVPLQCLNLGSGRIELDLLEHIPGAEGGVLFSCIT